ncbi:hypothetical protein [Cobetia marina]|uniref:hypothetical protein n=1 Tax=Cobetia marina TaxID=28258 RepID=UPI001969D157|nr:hypothetical protein [Cobetia marina]
MLASMHAMVLRNPGPDADFECTQCPLPEPGPGQVRIRVAASSVNPLDLKLASGQVALLPPNPASCMVMSPASSMPSETMC